MFSFRDTCSLDPEPTEGTRVEVAFTDATLDLQGEKDGFEEALATLVEAVGVPFARLHQVHGAEVVTVVDDPPVGPSDDVPVADALVTARRGIGLMVRVADCVPVVLADPAAGVVGDRMRELGADDIHAWIGPHVCGRCYEVPESMRREVAAAVPAARSETAWGTPALDLGAGVEAQLQAAGVPVVRIDRCTLEDDQLHSFRRDGADAGRFAGLVWTR